MSSRILFEYEVLKNKILQARKIDGQLILTIECEIDLLEINPKYPKNPKNFGEMIRKKRMDKRFTMKDIARRLDVTETTVYNWEVRNRRPYRKTEEKLKAVLDLKEEIPI